MDCLRQTIEKFRTVFGAEALVDILQAEPRAITARFHGNMCYTCGTVDYFEDFAAMYSECAGEDWTVESYRQNPDGSYTAVLKPRSEVKTRKRHIKVIIAGEEIDYTVETT
ncbi:hypothetical protein [Pyrobaculum neutrophilum]|uniref:Uncharacterized protein n=1 Tax=Pyrobaculum neutrophilum (strain DSM 2338 / JCM 9278 / NBRC 100436 / V24Sta) TaxID=444157 RepID=B1YCL5_PYRNV|nr:hypothetical protein [Pyrobaculum neutrophilum]ACB39528.1 conserved hypothetical protein [Pyrobaculum neutrophilum V24Sta]